MSELRFPLFVDLTGKRLVVVGGGAIARRRIDSLLPFGGEVVVGAPSLRGSPEGLTWLPRPYAAGDLEGAFLAVAATDSRPVNRQVGLDARALGIPVSVADCREECTFYFPALCQGGGVTAGVISAGGADHRAAARAAARVRLALEELE